MNYQQIKSFYIQNQYTIIIIFVILLYLYSIKDKELFTNNDKTKIINQLKQQKYIKNVIQNEKENKKKEEQIIQEKKQKDLQKKINMSKQDNKSQITKLQQISIEDSIKNIKTRISNSANPIEQKALQSQLISLQQAYALKNSSINF